MNQARPDLDKRPKRGFETDDDRPEADTVSGQADLSWHAWLP